MAAVRPKHHADFAQAMMCRSRWTGVVVAVFMLLAAPEARAQAGTTSGFTPLVADSLAKGALGTRVTMSFAATSVADAVAAIAKQAGLSLTYDPALPGLDAQVS